MRRVLLILTQSMDPLNEVVTRAELALPGHLVEVVDLTVENPDYSRLLNALFEAESVQVW
jgi:hypothetical protein